MAVLPVLYLLAMVSLLVVALRLMWFNVNQINKMLNNPVEVNPRLQHPELENVKNGDELMVVNFQQVPNDPMLQSLKKRLDNGPEIDDPWDEDDDGDGDVPALLKPRV